MAWHDSWAQMKGKKQSQPQAQTRRHERGGRVAGVAKQTTAAKARKNLPCLADFAGCPPSMGKYTRKDA